MSTMHIVIGAPATGGNFFPRESVIQRLQLALKTEHVLFLAPRRTGKTSVLLNLRERAQARTVYLNLEAYDHPGLWIEAMASELSSLQDGAWKQMLKKAGDWLPRLKTRYGHIEAADWTVKADALMDDLNKVGEPIWFLLDEFPTLIDLIAKHHGVALAESTLHWLRRIRQQTTSPVRFLLTGSIGLDAVLRRHRIRGPANDLRREELKPLREDEALTLAMRLAKDNDVPLAADLAQAYVRRLGPARWPFLIQLFVAELQEADPPLDGPESLERLYRAVAYGRRNQYADNMWSRLGDVFEPDLAALAKNILRAVAARDDGLTHADLRAGLSVMLEEDYDYILDVLRHDGYLTESDDGRLLFHSHLLRDYWRHKARV